MGDSRYEVYARSFAFLSHTDRIRSHSFVRISFVGQRAHIRFHRFRIAGLYIEARAVVCARGGTCWTVLSLFVGLYDGVCAQSYDVRNAFTLAFGRIHSHSGRIHSHSGRIHSRTIAFSRFSFRFRIVDSGSRPSP